MHSLKAVLLLEDGSIIYGRGFGSPGQAAGELVFNTGMSGYESALTDPSYYGQILMMTYPLIGNYGVSPSYQESPKIQVRGFIVREVCNIPTHRLSNQDIDKFLKSYNIPGICEIDTRMLTLKIRKYGTMKAMIKAGEILPSPSELTDLLKELKDMPWPEEQNLVADVSCPAGAGSGSNLIPSNRDKEIAPMGKPSGTQNETPKVVVIDCGSKANIIRELLQRGCEVITVPYCISAGEIKALSPVGILISNGPGNPAHPEIMATTVKTIRQIINSGKSPAIMGICLGHQILALAFGAKTYKLKFGHRGANQPVKDIRTGKVYITAQNHGFAVDPDSCPSEVEVVGVNVSDNTVEALQHRKLPVFSVQYHPEASPGPWDNKYLFDRFVSLCQNGKT